MAAPLKPLRPTIAKPVAGAKPQPLKPQAPTKPAARLAPLPFMVDQVPDPLEGMDTDGGFAEHDPDETQREIVAKLTEGYRAVELQQAAYVKEANSTEYYRVFVFETSAQAEAFAKALGVKVGDIYLDGRELAAKLGVELPLNEWKPKRPKPDPKFAARALPLKPQVKRA